MFRKRYFKIVINVAGMDPVDAQLYAASVREQITQERRWGERYFFVVIKKPNEFGVDVIPMEV